MSEASKTPVTDAGNVQLKECPFCGHEAKTVHGSGYRDTDVTCSNCSANVQELFGPNGMSAVSLWNKRTLETQLTDARADSERLAAALKNSSDLVNRIAEEFDGDGDEIWAKQLRAKLESATEALSAHKSLNQKENEL